MPSYTAERSTTDNYVYVTAAGLSGDISDFSVVSCKRYALRKSSVQNNSTTDFFAIDADEDTFCGRLFVSAKRLTEYSSHVYIIHADGDDVELIEDGAGRDSNASISLTATLASGVVTVAAVTANNWAGDSISVSIMADIVTSSGSLTFTDS